MLEILFATEEDLAEVFSNVFDSWRHADTLEEHISKRLASPQHRYAQWLVGRIDSKIVSSLGVYPFEYAINGQKLKACGIGAVHTLPDHRSKGYAKQMFSYLHGYLEEQDVKLSFLFSDIGSDYYKTLGYQELNLDHYKHKVASKQVAKSLYKVESSDWSEYREFFDGEDLCKSHTYRSQKHWNWLEARWPHPTICRFHGDDLEAMFLLELSNKACVLDGCWPKHWSFQKLSLALDTICMEYKIDELGIWLPRSKLVEEGFGAVKEIAMIYPLEPLILEEIQLFPIDHI